MKKTKYIKPKISKSKIQVKLFNRNRFIDYDDRSPLYLVKEPEC